VSFLYRSDYYKKTVNEEESEESSGEALDEHTSISELIIAKHRNGPTCTIKLVFKRNISRFIDIEK
jgi:replicative DNA helicase